MSPTSPNVPIVSNVASSAISRRGLLSGSAVVVAGAALLPLAPEAAAATAPRYASHEFLSQQQGNWCAPGSARIALTAQDRGTSQRTLASELGVSLDPKGRGLPDIGNLPRVLNNRLGTKFYAVRDRRNFAEYKSYLDADVKRCIDSGFVVLINTWFYTRGRSVIRTSSGHYMTIAGYRDGAYLIADPASYKNSFGNLGTGVWWSKSTVWGWQKNYRWVGTFTPRGATNWSRVEVGSNGYRVSVIQYLLRSRGYRIAVDGSFGNQTRGFVQAFQRANRLGADGVVGGITWLKLIRGARQGTNGDVARAVQKAVTAVGLPTSVDGNFGPGTKRKVQAFQRTLGLTQDGVVGQTTWSYLV